MNQQWHPLLSERDYENLLNASQEKPQYIFKHSTRCPVSMMAYRVVDQVTEELIENADIHYVDVITSRPVSLHIAEVSGVIHQSPQAILFYKGEVIWDASHGAIMDRDLKNQVSALNI